ncbi:MAG: NADH oxidase [bacterium]|nr:MAG: NADH oxidase [bacterium]
MAEKYLILGTGASGLSAVRTIKKIKPSSDIYAAFSDDHPYSRMLIPYYLTSEITGEKLYDRNEKFLNDLGVKLLPGRKATKLFADTKRVEFDNGEIIGYDKLLIATGSVPVVPERWSSFERVVSLWDYHDVERFKGRLDSADEIVIIGSGFIGMIFANALYKIGKKITIIEKLDTVLPKMLPETAALMFREQLMNNGVTLVTGDAITEIDEKSDKITISTENGKEITGDMAVIAVGIKPNIDFLKSSGITIKDAIIVDKQLKTNDESIYAAGDIAECPALRENGNAIYPTWPAAVEHGEVAGSNMAGEKRDYLGGLLYNSVTFGTISAASFGRWNDTDAEIVRWKDPAKGRFIQFCIKNDIIIGASLLGDNDRIGIIKGLIEQGKKIAGDFLKNPSAFANEFLLSNYFAGNAYKG